jgi:hypothetical protein
MQTRALFRPHSVACNRQIFRSSATENLFFRCKSLPPVLSPHPASATEYLQVPRDVARRRHHLRRAPPPPKFQMLLEAPGPRPPHGRDLTRSASDVSEQNFSASLGSNVAPPETRLFANWLLFEEVITVRQVAFANALLESWYIPHVLGRDGATGFFGELAGGDRRLHIYTQPESGRAYSRAELCVPTSRPPYTSGHFVLGIDSRYK